MAMRLGNAAAQQRLQQEVLQPAHRSTARPLPADLRQRLEPELGGDLSGVQLHQDDHAAQATQALGAQAFASGSHIFLSQGLDAQESGEQGEVL